MMRWCLLLLTLTANCCFAQAKTTPPDDAKTLGTGKAWVHVSRGPHENAILEVLLSGSEDTVNYADVIVHAFDREGREISAITALSGKKTYTNLEFGKYRGDTNIGFYKLDGKEEDVGKVVIERKGDRVEFPDPKRATYLKFKPIRGGQAAVSFTILPRGEVALDVLLKDIFAPTIKYDEIKLTAFDKEGSTIALSPLFKEQGAYILGSKDKGVFTGKYRIASDSAHVTKIVMLWAGEQIEFSDF